jgi:hypothetical protein
MGEELTFEQQLDQETFAQNHVGVDPGVKEFSGISSPRHIEVKKDGWCVIVKEEKNYVYLSEQISERLSVTITAYASVLSERRFEWTSDQDMYFIFKQTLDTFSTMIRAGVIPVVDDEVWGGSIYRIAKRKLQCHSNLGVSLSYEIVLAK